MTDPELWRTALHEAGHAYCRHIFGLGVGVVSVRPSDAHQGIVVGDGSGPQRIILGGHPLDGLDPAQRQLADRVLVMLLAGRETADLFAPRLGRQPRRSLSTTRCSPGGRPVRPRRRRRAGRRDDRRPWPHPHPGRLARGRR